MTPEATVFCSWCEVDVLAHHGISVICGWKIEMACLDCAFENRLR